VLHYSEKDSKDRVGRSKVDDSTAAAYWGLALASSGRLIICRGERLGAGVRVLAPIRGPKAVHKAASGMAGSGRAVVVVSPSEESTCRRPLQLGDFISGLFQSAECGCL
jgi:hypothetical protein